MKTDFIDNVHNATYTINETEMQVLHNMFTRFGFPLSQPHLANGITQVENAPCLEGEKNMARIKSKITIDGKECWISADSIQGLVDKVVIASQQQAEQLQEKSDAPLFKEYVMRWFKVYCEPKVKITTAGCVRSYMRKHFIPFFGNKPMDCITVDDVQAFLNQRSKLAERTLKDYRMWLAQVFDAAVDDGYMAKNPARNKRIAIPSRKVTEREALSEADYMDILSNINKLHEKDRLYVALAMLTGMRRGEILGLQYADIDRDGGWIHVRRNVTYPNVNKPIIGTPKSKKGYRNIPILPQLASLLPDCKDELFIFGGDKPLSHMQMVNTWARITKKIDMHGATLHSLRHSFLTLASNSGIEPKTIQALAGHADVSITMNRYVHAQVEPIRRAGMILGEKINSLGTFLEYGNSPQPLAI